MKKRHEQKLVLLSISLMILLNMPFLLLVDSSEQLFGLPAIYVYIFALWIIGFCLTFYIVKKFDE
jgi:hypothetical protein